MSLDVVVLRGAPGAGKSTLAARLTRRMPRSALVEVDVVRGMLSRVDWSDRAQHDLALAGAMDLVQRFLHGGRRPIVLVDTFSRDLLTGVQARFDAEGIAHHTVSLRLDPDELARRLRERASGFKAWEPTRILNDEVTRRRYPHETLLDVSGVSPRGVTARVLLVLRMRAAERRIS